MIDRRKLLLGGAALSLSGCKILDGVGDKDSALHAFFASAEKATMISQRAQCGPQMRVRRETPPEAGSTPNRPSGKA